MPNTTPDEDPRANVIRTLVMWTRNNVSNDAYDEASEAAIAILSGLGYAPGNVDRYGIEVGDEVQSLLIVALARLWMPTSRTTIEL